MKISGITCAALLTVATVDAAAHIGPSTQPTTQPQPMYDAKRALRDHGDDVCRGSGQMCGLKAKLKRVAEAAAHIDSTNTPTTVSESSKAKRAAAAAPEYLIPDNSASEPQLIHEANKATRPHGADTCRGSGQTCGIKAKIKRAAAAIPNYLIPDNSASEPQLIHEANHATRPHGADTCRGTAQVCGIKAKLKRAASAAAAASALADPIVFAEPPHRFCYIPGGECSNAKREALALAEAAAEAYAIAEPDANPCYLPGGECSNAKREAIAAAEEMAERDAGAFPDAEAEASATNDFCNLPEESCTKLRRATEDITEALAGIDGDLA